MPYEIATSSWEEEDRKEREAQQWQEEHSWGPDGNMTLEEFQDYLDSKSRTMFISGYEDLTTEEFGEHYEPEILKSIDRGDTLLMAFDENGSTAKMALRYLESKDVAPERVTFYRAVLEAGSMATSFGEYKIVDVEGPERDRDEALTRDSAGDILWLRGEDQRKCSGMSASECLDTRFDQPVMENDRRRSAAGIQGFMDAYDEVV